MLPLELILQMSTKNFYMIIFFTKLKFGIHQDNKYIQLFAAIIFVHQLEHLLL
jgi:hypothetical protein